MIIDLTFDVVKYVCTRLKTDYDQINFTKINVGEHLSINDDAWDYWVYDSYESLCSAWPDYVSEEFPNPPHTIPPEQYM